MKRKTKFKLILWGALALSYCTTTISFSRELFGMSHWAALGMDSGIVFVAVLCFVAWVGASEASKSPYPKTNTIHESGWD
jgi:hypothetical protein